MSPPTTSESDDRALAARARLVFLVTEFEEWLSKGVGEDAHVAAWQDEIVLATREYVHLLLQQPAPPTFTVPTTKTTHAARERFLLIEGGRGS